MLAYVQTCLKTVVLGGCLLLASPAFAAGEAADQAAASEKAPSLSASPAPSVEALTGILSELSAWSQDPLIIESVLLQGESSGRLTKQQILALEHHWMTEASSPIQPMHAHIANSPLSVYLKDLQRRAGDVYKSICVYDATGLVVGQTKASRKYFYGDDPVFEAIMAGQAGGGLHLGEVVIEAATGRAFTRVQAPLRDPQTGERIGLVKVGLYLDVLEQRLAKAE